MWILISELHADYPKDGKEFGYQFPKNITKIYRGKQDLEKKGEKEDDDDDNDDLRKIVLIPRTYILFIFTYILMFNIFNLPFVSLISSSFLRILAKSCTIASDKSSNRFNSTSTGFNFAASPICDKKKQ